MKRSETKPKKVVSTRTKLSEIRDAMEKSGAGSRPDTKVSALLEAREKASAAVAQIRESKATVANPIVAEYANVLAHAVDTFGSRTNANAWLNRPNRVFNQKSPLQILTQDPAAVEEELVRIDHGISL